MSDHQGSPTGPAPVQPPVTVLTPDKQLFQNALQLAAASAIVTHWEKLSAWVVAGFAAAAALIMSHYPEAVALTSPGTVKSVLLMFIAVAVLHVVQRLLGTSVLIGVASSTEAAKITAPKLTQDEARLMLDCMARAVLWPMRLFVRASYRRMLAGDITHFGKITSWMAQGSMVAALLQVLLGLWAVVRVWHRLHA